MDKLIAPFGVLMGAAVWFVLFVILGTGLGTAFIAGGCAAAAGVLTAAMMLAEPTLDAPLTVSGLLAGIATFVILEVVLSVPLWIGVVAGLGAIGLYSIVDASVRLGRIRARGGAPQERRGFTPFATHRASNGHDRTQREPVGAR